MSGHEPLSSHREVKPGSNRSFGVTFAFVSLIIAVWPLWSGGHVRIWAIVAALGFAVVAFVAPDWFAPFNRAWFWLGQALHHVVNPVVMALIYFGSVVPTGLVLKMLGKDPLRLRRDRAAVSYWVPRDPPGPPPGSMPKQF
jgi:saxitoxin biosynthesis operon SxtJ-like protein